MGTGACKSWRYVGHFHISLSFFKKYQKTIPSLSWRRLLDWVVVVGSLVGAFIRVGNFINQEILGKVYPCSMGGCVWTSH
ncbi:MAG: prolipoprotein diacylglyceryl transferase [Rhabdochlamydiaceae bacterium]|jgi:prolipoprotein diacylglyceryltransferase